MVTLPIYLHKLVFIQKKAVKVIGGERFSEGTTQFYAKLKILKLLNLYKIETAQLVDNYMNSKFSLSFSDCFNKSCDVFNRSPRTSVNGYNLYKSLYCTNRMQRSIKYQGVKIWNSIPQTIQKLPKTFFKIKLKSFLLQPYNMINYLQKWKLKLSISKTVSACFHLNNRKTRGTWELYVQVDEKFLLFCAEVCRHIKSLRKKLTPRVALLRQLAGLG